MITSTVGQNPGTYPSSAVTAAATRQDDADARRPAGNSGTSAEVTDSVSLSPEARQKSQEATKQDQAVEKLKQIEVKVKAHEAAHKAAGGQYAGAVSYQYQVGPDGRSYVVGGEVQIDLSTGKTPEETISKMQTVIRAALAPGDPSGQDRAVAAQASSIMGQAQQEKATDSQSEDPSAAVSSTRSVGDGQKGADPSPVQSPDPSAASSTSNSRPDESRRAASPQSGAGISIHA